MRRGRLLAASAVLMAGLGLAPPASAQLVRPTPRRPPSGSTTVTTQTAVGSDGKRGDLKGRFGVPLAEKLLAPAEGDLAKRRRGLVRLAGIGTPQAIELLVRTWETDAPLARDGFTRLSLVRAVAPLAKEKAIREILQRLVTAEPVDDFTAMASAGAALALAATDDAEATDFLVALSREGESSAEIARRALAALPPQRLPSALGPRAVASVPLVRLAVALRDLRSIPFLRAAVRSADGPVRTAALVALGELGDGEAVLIGRAWLTEPEEAPRLAALRVLSVRAPAECVPALVTLLDDPARRDEALEIAEIIAENGLFSALARIANNPDAEIAVRAFPALGKLLDDRAPRLLETKLEARATSLAAAAALALSPSKEAQPAVERALAAPRRRLSAVYAALARRATRRDVYPTLEAVVEGLAQGDAEDRATAAFARASLGLPLPSTDLSDENRVSSVARGLLVTRDRRALAAGLDRDEVDEVVGIALLDDDLAAAVPSSRLLRWAESGGAHAPLAARALAARDEEAMRPYLDRLFVSPDLAVRAHVALGLGSSPRPDAAARLAEAYERETRASVRRAEITALSRRPGVPVAERALALARALDPDDRARSLAATTRFGTTLPTGLGKHTVFLRVEGATPTALFRFELPTGLVLPVRASPQGALVVPGLSAGPSQVSLASSRVRREEGP